MSSLKKLNGLQMGGAGIGGEEGYPPLENNMNLNEDNIRDYETTKNAYIIWNNYFKKDDFTEFYNDVFLPYENGDKSSSLAEYTTEFIKRSTKRNISERNTNVGRKKPQGQKKNESLRQSSAPAILTTFSIEDPIIDFLKEKQLINLLKEEPNSILNKLKRDQKGINEKTSDYRLLKFFEGKYKAFNKSFGSDYYPLFEKTLKRWRDYPVPLSFASFLQYYIDSFEEWKKKINLNAEDFDTKYFKFYSEELIPTWIRTIEDYRNKTEDEQIDIFFENIPTFEEYISQISSERTNVNMIDNQQAQRPCSTDDEPFEQQEQKTILYNKLITCLDIGKDAGSTSGLNASDYGDYMLNNIITPLFGYNDLVNADLTKDVLNNYKGIGDRSLLLFNKIKENYPHNFEYIPILRTISTAQQNIISPYQGVQEPALITTMSGNTRYIKFRRTQPLYTIQDAGFGPTNLFSDYINLFTFAGMLDTAPKTIDNRTMVLKGSNIYEISQDILKKYGLDTCIKKLTYQFIDNKYKIHIETHDFGTIDEYFNTQFNPINVSGIELERRGTRNAEVVEEVPSYYSKGNRYKNDYIRNHSTEGDKQDIIKRLVLIKELGDTLQAVILDQMLIYKQEAFQKYPELLDKSTNILPFCRENCVITTGDYNLLTRCITNNINSVISSGAHVIRANIAGSKLKLVPFYTMSGQGAPLNFEQLKNDIIEDIYSRNKEIIEMLVELGMGDLNNVYFDDKTIEEIQRINLTLEIQEYQGHTNQIGYVNLLTEDLNLDVPKTVIYRKYFLKYVLLYISSCLDFVNDKIKEILVARTVQSEDRTVTNMKLYLGFLLEAEKFRFDNPFETDIVNNNIIYKYRGNQDYYGFSFLSKIFGTEKINTEVLSTLESGLKADFFKYNKTNHKDDYIYKDFSSFYYFQMNNDLTNFNKTLFGQGSGSIYRILNNRIEASNFIDTYIDAILKEDNKYYLVISPAIYNEIDLSEDIPETPQLSQEINQDVRNIKRKPIKITSYSALQSMKEKQKVYNKCIKEFNIGGIINHIATSRGFGEKFDTINWIYNNSGPLKLYLKELEKLRDFSKLLNIEDKTSIIHEWLFNDIDGAINNRSITYNVFYNKDEIRRIIEANFNIDIAMFLTTSLSKSENDVFGDYRKFTLVNDTLVLEDWKNYPDSTMAKQLYLNREIAEFINQLVEKYIIHPIKENNPRMDKSLEDKLHLICANLTFDLKIDLQKKVRDFIENGSIIQCPKGSNITIKKEIIKAFKAKHGGYPDIYTGYRVDDTTLSQSFWNTISLDNISFDANNYLVKDGNPIVGGGTGLNYDEDLLKCYATLMREKYNEIINVVGLQNTNIEMTGQTGGGPNDPSTIENNSKLDIDFPPFNSKLTNIDPSMFNPTIFQKYFQNIDPASQKPGLLTFHMLCYFPKVIFMVYSLLKYIEHETDLQTSYNASYKPLKNILIKFYERDFSDQLNRIFHDIVGDRVDPTYDEQEDFTIADLTAYDNATAVIIDIAQQMYNVAGLFKVGEEQFKADLALFNTHVLKMEPVDLFLNIAKKENKYDIEYLYGRLFDAEYYVCDTKGGPEEEFNSIRVFEKFLANGVYSYGEAEGSEAVGDNIMKQAEVETDTNIIGDTIKNNIPQKLAAPGAPKKEDVGFLAKMLDTLGLGKEEEEEPMPVRKLNFGMNANENPTVVAYGGKKTKKKSAAKKYKKTRKVRKHK